MFTEIKAAIEKADNIIILPHKSADADCLGSAFALKLILKKLGKKALVMLEEKEPFPHTCGILNGVEEQVSLNADLVIAVDCGDLERLGERIGVFKSCPETVNIDHHPTNTMFAKYNFVDINAAATGEIIFHLAEFMNVALDRDIAENLYAAIVSDTGRFSYSNTTENTHIIAAKLHGYKINHTEINEFLFERNSLNKLMLVKAALNSLQVYKEGKIAAVEVTREQLLKLGATEEDASGLISYPRSLETALISVCFRESTVSDTVKVSLRSNIYDVAQIAKQFGGGGHIRASGCSIAGNLKDAKEKLLDALFKVIE